MSLIKVICNREDMELYSLTYNKVYEVNPLVMNSKSGEHFYYIVKCDDGLKRKFLQKYFTTIDEFRDDKLNQLGI